MTFWCTLQILQNCEINLKNSDCQQEIKQEINSLPAECIVIIVNFIHSVLNADYAQIIERMKLAKDIVTNQKPERFGVNVIGEKQNILENIAKLSSLPRSRIDQMERFFGNIDDWNPKYIKSNLSSC